MNKLYLMFMQRFAGRTLARQPEMDILMMDHSQDAEYSRDGQDGSLASVYDLIINAILRLSPPSGRALDICCGSASLLCRLASAFPKMQFLGVDLSQTMLEFAQEHRDEYGLKNLKFKRGDMYKLAEAAEPPYDLITWHLAMHHCTDKEAVVKVLNQIPHLLKPGGTFFVFDINRPKTGSLALLMADTFNRTQGDWYYQDSLDSYKAAFSFEEVEEILSVSDLKAVRHVEPVLANMFQAFFISQANNPQAPMVANLRYLWQKIDYFLLKLSFRALPLASGSPQEIAPVAAAHTYADLAHTSSDVADILEVGTRAMSAYNVQPWRFRIDGDLVLIHCIRRKNFFLKLPGVYYMMVGHLLANLLAGASSKGYRAEYEVLSEALSVDEPCVRLKLIRNDGIPHDISHVLNRTTNRYGYSSRKLSAELKKQLLDLCDDQNIAIHFSEDEEKNKFATILEDLERVRLNNTHLVLEGVEFIRVGREQSERHGDGLDASTLGLSPIAILFLKLIQKFPLLYKILKMSGFISLLYLKQKDLINQSGAIISFMVRRCTYQDYIKLGIVVQSIANKLTEQGLASMPVLSGLYLFDALSENGEIFSSADKNKIIECQHKLTALLNSGDQRVSYVLRAGYADKSPPKTVRRNIRELIYGARQKINAA